MLTASDFPTLGWLKQVEEGEVDSGRHRPAGQADPTVAVATGRRKVLSNPSNPAKPHVAVDDDMSTMLARQGSRFGLPIALQLSLLMKGGIGIVEVRPCFLSLATLIIIMTKVCSHWSVPDATFPCR